MITQKSRPKFGEFHIPPLSSGILTATYVSYSSCNSGRAPKNGLAPAVSSGRPVPASEVTDEDKEDREDALAVIQSDGDAAEELSRDPEAMASIHRGEADIAAGRSVAWRDIRRD